jgi:hypothetical protein
MICGVLWFLFVSTKALLNALLNKSGLLGVCKSNGRSGPQSKLVPRFGRSLAATGGPLMRVVGIDGEFANCVWVDKYRHRARFRLDELVLHEKARRVTSR